MLSEKIKILGAIQLRSLWLCVSIVRIIKT